jgi:hypothetical protein
MSKTTYGTMKPLPPRTANTMSDAIAIASPNGRMSKRAKANATKRLGEALFGPGGATREQIMGGPCRQPTPAEQAAQLRSYALMAGPRQAKKLLAEADRLETKPAHPLTGPGN